VSEQVRTRTRSVQPKSPPESWPNGCVLRDNANKILGITVRNKNGSVDVWRLEPVFVGTAPDDMHGRLMLTGGK
jgi:hypothetical protein